MKLMLRLMLMKMMMMMMEPKIILDCCMKKMPSNRLKARLQYRVIFMIDNDGKPRIDYYPKSRKTKLKSILLENLLFTDKKHDIDVKFSFSIYTIDKTLTFVAQSETIRDEWLDKLREHHSLLFTELKQYDTIFEANLLSTGLAKTMRIYGPYRIALCKESLDLVPHFLQQQQQLSHQQQQQQQNQQSNKQTNNNNNNDHQNTKTSSTTTSNTTTTTGQESERQEIPPQLLPNNRKLTSHRRHPYLSSKTIELSLRTIRRVGHSGNQFFLESGRQSQIGEGDLWMTVNKNSTARLLHELLLAAMRDASQIEDHFLSSSSARGPRSRSGSSTVASTTSASNAAAIAAAAAAATTIKNINILTAGINLGTSNNNNNLAAAAAAIPIASSANPSTNTTSSTNIVATAASSVPTSTTSSATNTSATSKSTTTTTSSSSTNSLSSITTTNNTNSTTTTTNTTTNTTTTSAKPHNFTNNNIDEDSAYMPMA